MKAVQTSYDGGALRIGEVPDPEIRSPFDVIVKLEAAAVNRIDLALCDDARRKKICRRYIPGTDGAGTVVAVGSAVTHIKSGDPICLFPVLDCGECRACTQGDSIACSARHLLGEREHGTYAELVRVPAKNCFAIPNGLSSEEAAAFPLVYATAWRMLFRHAELKPGEWVLIMGAGGGIATAALQLANSIGARIIVASGSEPKLDRAKALGAIHGVSYRDPQFAAEVRRLTEKRGVDVVVEWSGGENWARCLAALARGGRLVTSGAGAPAKTDLRRVFWNHLKIFGARPGSAAEFGALLNFIGGSGLRPVIDRVFALEDTQRAHEHMQAGRQFGKIVLRVGR